MARIDVEVVKEAYWPTVEKDILKILPSANVTERPWGFYDHNLVVFVDCIYSPHDSEWLALELEAIA